MIIITNTSVNHFEDVTTITAEVYETIGSIEKLKNKFIVNLPGQHTGDLESLVYQELNNNGLI
jgi:hypothetical protein